MEQLQIDEAVCELHTVADVVRWSVSWLNQTQIYYGHGTDNPWDEVIALLMYGLNLPVHRFNEIGQTRLTTSEKRYIIDLLKRRIVERIPVPYITNEGWFNGQPYYVDERVLIPRSPIAELIAEQFSPWLQINQPQRILDLCTGSGCIGIECAKAFDDAQVDLVDISMDALAVCEINIQEHGVSDRAIPILSDLFAELNGHTYDLIVANPPYVDEEDFQMMPKEYCHEPSIALASGVNGLDVTNKILLNAEQYLADNGLLVVEVGNSKQHLVELLTNIPFIWPEFEQGGHGVFILTKEALRQHQNQLNQVCSIVG